MTGKKIELLADRVEREFLPFVRQPARYVGGEVNQVRKDLSRCDLRVALCFPDVYEVGMSYTGMAIIYHVLNQMENVAAERVFAPWTDVERLLRQKAIPLFSLESKASLRSFDVIGFSLTNELCYANVLNMLDLGGLPVRSDQRNENDPIVVAGGGMAHCCEPIADFIDLFVLGEGEEAAVQLAGWFIEAAGSGLSKRETLLEAARRFAWAYVPQFYDPRYDGARLVSLTPTQEGVPLKRNSAMVGDFENAPFPTRPIVPFHETIHERISVEIMRGCPGRCRFCQASFCRRPIRFRSVDKICELARRSYENTGFDTVSLLSLSTADYPHLEELVGRLQGHFQSRHVGLSIPSLRVDQQLQLVPKFFAAVRKSGLTLAVEAAGERLRQIVNKPIKNSDLFAAVEAAYRAGWEKVKLYFMVGLPGETLDDVRAIVELTNNLARLRRSVDGKTGQINVTVSWFVPKPHTPLAWMSQSPRRYFEEARSIIIEEKLRRKARYLQFKFHDIGLSELESALGRGDRRQGAVIEAAWRAGARFDLWDEQFNYETWKAAFTQCGMDLETEARKSFDRHDLLPWDHLGGPDKAYLLTHYDATAQLLQPAIPAP